MLGGLHHIIALLHDGFCSLQEGYKYIIRLAANSVLQEALGWPLKRSVGRPPPTPASVTKLAHGAKRAGAQPTWNGTPTSSIRASGKWFGTDIGA